MVFASRGYKIFEKIENIKAFLKEQSQIYQEEMDFYFLGFATFCNRHGENNFKKIHLLNLFDKDANYIAKVDIKQIYRVELCKKKERENLPFKVELIPQADTTLMATLIPKVKVEYYLFNAFRREIINEQSAKNNINRTFLWHIWNYNRRNNRSYL